MLPHTDITIVFFGADCKNLINTAKRRYPASIAAKADSQAVFQYRASPKLGGGSLSIYLSDDWGKTRRSFNGFGHPDVLIGLNYRSEHCSSWPSVLKFALAGDKPFALTSFSEQIFETERLQFPIIAKQLLPTMMPDDPEMSIIIKRNLRDVISRSETIGFPFAANPFHRPGLKSTSSRGYRLPFVVNGFTMKVSGFYDKETEVS